MSYQDVAVKVLSKAFEVVWKEYPRKLGKQEAFKHYKAQVTTEEDKKNIVLALNKYIAHIETEGIEERFILHGSTWFNNIWRDWFNYTPTHKKPSCELYRTFYPLLRMEVLNDRKP